LNRDIETFRKFLKKCPICGSSEGFWLGAKLRCTYFQCKHCGTIIEATELVQLPEKETKEGKLKKFLRKLSF